MNDWADLHALADGELEGAEKKRAEQLIRENAGARREYESILGLKRLVSEKRAATENPELWKVCQGRFRELEKSRRVENFVGRWAWGMCGALAVGLVMARVATGSAGPAGVSSTQVATALGVGTRTSGTDTDLQRAINDLAAAARSELDFIDQQIWVDTPHTATIDNRKVHAFTLRDGKGELKLATFQPALDLSAEWTPMAGSASLCTAKINGAHFVTWRRGNVSFFLGGDRSPEELREMAARICPSSR